MKTWRERVAAAATRRRFTSEDKRLVSGWATCAIGEQHVIHPLVVTVRANDGGAPHDSELFRLGSSIKHLGFTDAVRCNAYRRAEKILDRIEDRVFELKREAHP